MATDIHKLIAAISPGTYCKKELRDEVKKIVQEKGYLEAAKKAEAVDSEAMNFDEIELKPLLKNAGLKNPIEKNTVSYDTPTQALEPVYFWVLDTMQQEYSKVDKVVDTFLGSSGSNFFAEMGQRATKMQDEAAKLLGAANQVVKSILNILYDLKEFEIRLEPYTELKSKDDSKKLAALLTLKQIWMDTVDIKRQTTSLKGLAQQFDYVTLIDAFMAAKSIEDVTKSPKEGGLDLNDRVRRLLTQRVGEFYRWLEISEKELKKRFEIEKTYLRSQVSTVKLYARWAKPYLKAARKLEQRATEDASLVTAFNTALFELSLLGEGKYDPIDDVKLGNFPPFFKTAKRRKYSPIGIVELKYRSIPERQQQGGYGFRGRVSIAFTSYALNEEELKVLKEQLTKDDVDDVFSLIEGATDESLGQLKEDIDKYLNDKPTLEKPEEKKASVSNNDNPFSALAEGILELFGKKKNVPSDKKEKDLSKGIESDSDVEKSVRSQAIIGARRTARRLYDSFKKANQMPAM